MKNPSSQIQELLALTLPATDDNGGEAGYGAQTERGPWADSVG
jgi:hypothetical protein